MKSSGLHWSRLMKKVYQSTLRGSSRPTQTMPLKSPSVDCLVRKIVTLQKQCPGVEGRGRDGFVDGVGGLEST